MSEALNAVVKALQARRDAEVKKNATGATDWNDYSRRKGKIQGLDDAIGEIDEVKRKLAQKGELNDE